MEKGLVCFVVFNRNTKGGEKQKLYCGRIVAIPGEHVDVRGEAVKTHACGDIHASKFAAWAVGLKKDSAHSPAKEAP